jgi:hypothetical protein
MKAYKIIPLEFNWKKKEKFEMVINKYSREGCNLVGFSALGDTGNSFIALIERTKHR